MLVVGFRSPRIEDDTLIAIIGRELLDICDIAPGRERCILLNFRGVEFCSSALIGKIVLMNKKAKARRISIRMSNVAPQPMRIFEVTRLNKVFSIVDDEEDVYNDEDEGIGAIVRAFCVRRGLGRSRQSEGERDGFRFAPELFEVRTDVIAELSNRGFDWLSHYSSVDPMHDVYGIEVCGIHRQEDASAILSILIEMFPDWRPG
jgi:anti-sigma B factor antagonist